MIANKPDRVLSTTIQPASKLGATGFLQLERWSSASTADFKPPVKVTSNLLFKAKTVLMSQVLQPLGKKKKKYCLNAEIRE